MVEQGCLVMFCLCTVISVIASSNNNNESTTMKQLEETVSDLQKHIVAQDQKQTAVLSNILFRLTETTDELTKLQHNYTILENELSSLKENSTSVDDLQKLIVAQEQKQTAVLSSVLSMLNVTTNELSETTHELAKLQHNYTVLENEFSSLKDNYTYVNGAGKSSVRQEVAFEATMTQKGVPSHYSKFLENSNLIFPSIKYNEGGCWNFSTGVFTAPVDGTYLFWIYLTFTDVEALAFVMKKNNQMFGKGSGHLSNTEDTTRTSLLSLVHLVEGDIVQFVVNRNVTFLPNASSCGGVLLNSALQ